MDFKFDIRVAFLFLYITPPPLPIEKKTFVEGLGWASTSISPSLQRKCLRKQFGVYTLIKLNLTITFA